MKLELQFFGGRGSGGSTGSKNVKSSHTIKSERDIDRLSFDKAVKGFDYVLSSGDRKIGEVRINKETVGGYSITHKYRGGVEDIDVVENLDSAKRIAREVLKGQWRTIYG